jgi:hypothetical protein
VLLIARGGHYFSVLLYLYVNKTDNEFAPTPNVSKLVGVCFLDVPRPFLGFHRVEMYEKN